MNYYLYILFSSSFDKFYIGHTSNIEERIRKHNTNHKGYTGKKNDWSLVYSEEYNTKEEAYAREREIKAWKSRVKILSLIKMDKLD